MNFGDQQSLFEAPQFAELRWFLLAAEAQDLLQNRPIISCKTAFTAKRFPNIQHNGSLWKRIEPNYMKNPDPMGAKCETTEMKNDLNLAETLVEIPIFQRKISNFEIRSLKGNAELKVSPPQLGICTP